jgi:hypothetical protein
MQALRFSALVKSSGRPEVVTLWGDPKGDPQFSKAIRENRVLTVQQNTAGKKSDFGMVGFHEGKSVSYFVFPKALVGSDGVRVVGIKYDLLDSQKTVGLVARPRLKKRDPKPPVTRVKSFSLTLRRIAIVETALEIQASNAQEAKESALKEIRRTPFDPREATISDEIRSIEEK